MAGSSFLSAVGTFHRSFVDIWVVTLIVIIVRMTSGSLQDPGLSDAWFQGVGDEGCFIFMMAIIVSQVCTNETTL
jgi:hypothetical protein